MFLASLLLTAAQSTPPRPTPEPAVTCPPVRNYTAAGPPPSVLRTQRIETAPEARVTLTVERCHRTVGGYRVERRISRTRDEGSELEWVPVAQCALLRRWVEAATRLQLPAPMLRPHRDSNRPVGGTWFVLTATNVAGLGSVNLVSLQILEPPGAAPNALSQWVRDGERQFQACRDQGHGGTGYVERRLAR